LKQDVFKFLKDPEETFDLIFADPPFDLPRLEMLPELILDSTAAHDETIVVIEHGKRTDLSGNRGFIQMKSYSNVRFSFFKKTV